MVSVTRAYSHFEDDNLDRYRGRGHGYPSSHDRELPTPGHGVYPPPRNPHLGGHENGTSDQGSDNSDIGSRPRSRIAVACGRCRKRKIRCSGDQGGPCSNCKSAGNESCQFLRVSSTETTMKSDSTGYEYDPSAGSRLNCRMIPFGPQSYGMGVDAYQYRHNSLSAFQFSPSSVKPYYSLPQYSDFADDYDINGSPYPLLPNDPLAIPSYTTSSTGRGWATPTPQLPRTPLYLEQPDSAYSHGQLPYHSGAFPLRPAISPEPKSLSMHGLTTSLPTTANDRLLPVPAANRQSGSFMRAADGFLAVSQPSFPTYDGLMSASVLTSLKNHSNSTGHNPSYMSTMSSSSSESHNSNSSQIAYSSGPILSSQSHEIYPQSGDNYTSGDSPDSAYGPSSPVSKQNSQNSLPLHPEDHLREPYRVPPYQQIHAPAPPIESPAPTRHTGASISAV